MYPMCIPMATSGYSILPVSQCVFSKYLTFMYSDCILDVSHAYPHGHFRIQYPTGIPVCILEVSYFNVFETVSWMYPASILMVSQRVSQIFIGIQYPECILKSILEFSQDTVSWVYSQCILVESQDTCILKSILFVSWWNIRIQAGYKPVFGIHQDTQDTRILKDTIRIPSGYHQNTQCKNHTDPV